MKLFRIYDAERIKDYVVFCGTRAEAKNEVDGVPKNRREFLVVEEIEVQTDKEGVIAMLNEEPLYKVLRTFGVTPRGALKEEKD